mmetsp:Transcript_32054/g.53207  ORF Transcript_32054/g.53207 Transcript_32054/m.53207 type:complete len:516 (-) Transcript_32054:1553-3100(-)
MTPQKYWLPRPPRMVGPPSSSRKKEASGCAGSATTTLSRASSSPMSWRAPVTSSGGARATNAQGATMGAGGQPRTGVTGRWQTSGRGPGRPPHGTSRGTRGCCTSRPRTGRTAPSSGAPTAPRPARSWSRTSGPARPAARPATSGCSAGTSTSRPAGWTRPGACPRCTATSAPACASPPTTRACSSWWPRKRAGTRAAPTTAPRATCGPAPRRWPPGSPGATATGWRPPLSGRPRTRARRPRCTSGSAGGTGSLGAARGARTSAWPTATSQAHTCTRATRTRIGRNWTRANPRAPVGCRRRTSPALSAWRTWRRRRAGRAPPRTRRPTGRRAGARARARAPSCGAPTGPWWSGWTTCGAAGAGRRPPTWWSSTGRCSSRPPPRTSARSCTEARARKGKPIWWKTFGPARLPRHLRSWRWRTDCSSFPRRTGRTVGSCGQVTAPWAGSGSSPPRGSTLPVGPGPVWCATSAQVAVLATLLGSPLPQMGTVCSSRRTTAPTAPSSGSPTAHGQGPPL